MCVQIYMTHTHTHAAFENEFMINNYCEKNLNEKSS